MKEFAKTHFGNASKGMLRSVINFVFAAANIAITQSMAAWNELMLLLKLNLETIDELQEIANQDITGYAAQKRSAKQALVLMTASIMRSVYAYAVKTGNDILANEMYATRSSLSRKKYETLVTFTQGIIGKVTAIRPQLDGYNITDEVIEQWQAANDLMRDLLSGPKGAKSRRVAVNKEIQQLLRSSVMMLTKQADGMALNFLKNATTAAYYFEYRANRKLDPTHLSTQLRATVYNGDMPAQRAQVTLQSAGLTETTNNKGYCMIDYIPFGEHMVTVTIDTQSQTFGPYRFKKGKSLSLKFEMGVFNVPAVQTETKKKATA